MCFYLTVSLTSLAFRFSFRLQMILTRGKRLIHTLFHMFLSFPITLFNWLKSSQGESLTAVLFWILQTTQPLPNLAIKIPAHSCRLATPFCCGLFHIACNPNKNGLRRAASSSSPCKCFHHSFVVWVMRWVRGEDKLLPNTSSPVCPGFS